MYKVSKDKVKSILSVILLLVVVISVILSIIGIINQRFSISIDKDSNKDSVVSTAYTVPPISECPKQLLENNITVADITSMGYIEEQIQSATSAVQDNGDLCPNVDWSDGEVTYEEYVTLLVCSTILYKKEYGNDYTLIQPSAEDMSHFSNNAVYEVRDGIMFLKCKIVSKDYTGYKSVKVYYDENRLILLGVE